MKHYERGTTTIFFQKKRFLRNARVKKILEQLSRTQSFKGFGILALFFAATLISGTKWAVFSNHVKNSFLEISNSYLFPLECLKSDYFSVMKHFGFIILTRSVSLVKKIECPRVIGI